MRKIVNGFTIVELLVVISVIGILATISMISFTRYQADSRDTQRSSKATILTEALEKYYDANGEYPGCLAVSGAGATVTTSILPGVELNTLLTPKSASTDTNSIKCQDLVVGGPDIFAYVGDGSAACNSGSACLTFTLKYTEEATGLIKTITSRRTTAPTTPLNVVATTNSSTQITVSWNSAPEAVSYNLEYSPNSNFTGSTFINGATGTSRAVTGLASGQRYYFRIYIVTNLATGQASSSATAVTTLNAPSAPTVAASTPSSITTYSWPAIACPASATARYQYRYVINYTGGYTSVWYGPIAGLSSTLDTSGAVYTYTGQVQAQCYNAIATSAWSTTGQASYSRPDGWSSIAGGYGHTCAIDSLGKAYCWGYNWYGQLGNNSTVDSAVSVAVYAGGVLSGKTLVSIVTGDYHTCAIDSLGKAYCWGNDGDYGELGNNSIVNSSVPVAVYTGGVLNGKTIVSISASEINTCAIDSLGKAYCWGNNQFGALGTGATGSYSAVPNAVNTAGVLSGKTLVTIGLQQFAVCALDSAGAAYCWGGNNAAGGLGNNSTINSYVPVAVYTGGVLSGKVLVSISGGSAYSCVIDSLGKAYCWGSGSFGNLGNNTTAGVQTVPVAVYTGGVLSGKVIVSMASMNETNCAITADSKVYCWGAGDGGQLGNNTTTQLNPIPMAVTTSGVLSGKTITTTSAAMGYFNSCVIASVNQAYCWGDNTYGQLGNNSHTSSLVPITTLPPL